MKKAWIFILGGILLSACGLLPAMRWGNAPQPAPRNVWDNFASDGERIYFTAIDAQGKAIPYQGGPDFGWMMMQPRLACVSCHGVDGRGGEHVMHMLIMNAPDIRYSALNSEMDEHGGEGEYDLEMFRQAVVEGKHPDGETLDEDMPRWQMSDEDLAALFEYLKTLP